MGDYTFTSTQQLFLLGGLAIAFGIFTYSKGVMMTVGGQLGRLTPTAAFVAVTAHSIVLFVFASRALSDWLTQMNSASSLPDYPAYSYVRLRDSIVGPSKAALPGRTAWWVDSPIWQSPHLNAPGDPRIVADISRRLRGEEAYATRPAAPLP